MLERVETSKYGATLTFKQTNSTERYGDSLQIRQADFHDMVKTDGYKSVKVYFNRETLEPDFDVMDKYERREKREALEAWVGDIGPDACHKLIDQIWSKQ